MDETVRREEVAEEARLEAAADAAVAAAAATTRIAAARESVGIEATHAKVPDRTFAGDEETPSAERGWADRVKRHVKSVLRGRCDTPASANLVASAIADSGDDVVLNLMKTPEFAEATKAGVEAALAHVQEHWTARLSVHLWDRLGLSDRGMGLLRHLLSFVYDPDTKLYNPIKVLTI